MPGTGLGPPKTMVMRAGVVVEPADEGRRLRHRTTSVSTIVPVTTTLRRGRCRRSGGRSGAHPSSRRRWVPTRSLRAWPAPRSAAGRRCSCCRGSPAAPPLVSLAMRARRADGEMPVAAETMGIWTMASCGVMSGSRPLPEVVTRSGVGSTPRCVPVGHQGLGVRQQDLSSGVRGWWRPTPRSCRWLPAGCRRRAGVGTEVVGPTLEDAAARPDVPGISWPTSSVRSGSSRWP